MLRNWAAGAQAAPLDLPFAAVPVAKPVPLDGSGAGHQVTLIETGKNTGFAGGVNVGLAHLAQDDAIDRFWVLNPDCAVPPETARVLAVAPDGFALLGGRIIYQDDPLAYAGDAVVYHKGGASIGSRTTRQKASPLSLYFIHRARIRFLWRFRKTGLPGGIAFSLAKAAQLLLAGDVAGAESLLRGTFQMHAPQGVRARVAGGV